MLPAADASSLSVLLGRLAVHQDLLWFGVLVGWGLIIVLWWRHPQRQSLWWLLPWTAGAWVLGALVQFLVFNPPFDLFLERLVPGANSSYLPALLDPNLTADLFLAALIYGFFMVWWQDAPTAGARLFRRWSGGVMLAGLVLIHWAWPQISCWLLAVLPIVPAWRLLRHPSARGASLITFLLPGLVPAFSTIGPVAFHAGMLQRSATSTPMGAVAAIFQLAVASLLLAHLWRIRPRTTTDANRPAALKMALPFLQAAILILIVGVGFALKTGQDNRWEVINGRLRTTVYNAGLLNPADFAVFTSESFQLTDLQLAPDGPGTARAPGLAAEITRASQAVAARVRATQFQAAAHFLVVRDGWLIEVASTALRPRPDGVVLRGRAGEAEETAWREARPHMLFSEIREQGDPYYCRAPVTDSDGRLLGWLEYPREEFYSSMARKWRTSPLLVTALGLVLTAALYFQKRANQEQERAVRAAAVEADANRLKTAFLAKVSHELRTPIQSLLGYGELLRSRLGDDAQARAWLGALQQHGEIMTRLINDLLDLSAAESGSFRLSPGAVAPATLVRQTVEGLRPRAEAKGLRLSCAATDAVPAWVEVDGGRLGQVVLNLAGNALKFTDAGEVSVLLDAAPAASGRVRLILTVSDTGPGIAPEEQSKLFEPFSRLDRTAAKEGTGLGLALSAALCRAMDGSLRVESDGRQGSRFIAECEAPVCAPPADAPAIAPAPVANETGKTPPVVLVIEDNTLLRELFISYLAGQGCVCTAAGNGAVALTRVQAVPPEVILLDLSLPDADGIDLMPALRSAAPRARIIGVSAHAGDAERARALAAGMEAFFTKPVPLATLGAAVLARPRPEPDAAAYHVPTHLRNVFREELTGLREELAGAVAEGDLPRVRRRAHYLRNSALVVEARELFEACTLLEGAAEQGAATAATEAWPRCEAAIVALLAPAV